MSQCKRLRAVAVSAPDCPTCFFDDLYPTGDADALLASAKLCQISPDVCMAYDARPDPMRSGIIDRLLPLGWQGDAGAPTKNNQTQNEETL
ncbi:MAG: DUF1636 family protein [Pseudomonadota bacterium]